MAGKALTQTSSKALAYAIDHLTKNQMADVLLDLARLQVGSEDVNEDLISVLQGWIGPILMARGDVAINLMAKHKRYVNASEQYLARQSPAK